MPKERTITVISLIPRAPVGHQALDRRFLCARGAIKFGKPQFQGPQNPQDEQPDLSLAAASDPL